MVRAADSGGGEWRKRNRRRTSEGVECFGGRDFAWGKEIGEGVLGGFCIKGERGEMGGEGVRRSMARNGRGVVIVAGCGARRCSVGGGNDSGAAACDTWQGNERERE
jgi:hypothetical protein